MSFVYVICCTKYAFECVGNRYLPGFVNISTAAMQASVNMDVNRNFVTGKKAKNKINKKKYLDNSDGFFL